MSRIRKGSGRSTSYGLFPLLKDWTVVDRLGEITTPTLVMAGREDFVFPPDCQRQLATGIPGARLHLIDSAGHNPHDEQVDEVMKAVREFLASGAARPLVSVGIGGSVAGS